MCFRLGLICSILQSGSIFEDPFCTVSSDIKCTLQVTNMQVDGMDPCMTMFLYKQGDFHFHVGDSECTHYIVLAFHSLLDAYAVLQPWTAFSKDTRLKADYYQP